MKFKILTKNLMIPFSRQFIDKSDVKSVAHSLKSNFLTQGPKVQIFEKNILKIVKAKYAVATNSGSSALHIACLSIGLKKGDIVWTVPNTFAASANCAINCGAKVDFVDIDEKSWNIDIIELEKKLRIAKNKKKLPKIVIPVHLAGLPSEQKKIWMLSKKFKFKIIEDASHSLGANYLEQPVGSCKWSDITIFSFHPTKIITTTEGGMALTNDKKLNEKMRMFATNGITKKFNLFKNKKNFKPWYYEQHFPGFNYRMSDVAAALGISQLKKLKKFVNKRNRIAKIYDKFLKVSAIKSQKITSGCRSSFHLYIVRVNARKSKFSHLKIFKKLRKNNIYVNLHYMPLHLNPFFKKLGFKKGQFPESEKYANEAISLPIYYGLKESKVKKICKDLIKYIS